MRCAAPPEAGPNCRCVRVVLRRSAGLHQILHQGNLRRMPDGPTSTDFESWFATSTEAASSDRRTKLRPWFRALHDDHGPVTMEVALIAWALQQLDASELAVALVLADVHRTTKWQVEVELATFGNAVEITVEGHTRAPATDSDPWDQHAIVSDIAEIIQEDVTEWRSEVWPVCASHGVGAHAEVQAGRAVWWCRSGQHVVSEIGLLGA